MSSPNSLQDLENGYDKALKTFPHNRKWTI